MKKGRKKRSPKGGARKRASRAGAAEPEEEPPPGQTPGQPPERPAAPRPKEPASPDLVADLESIRLEDTGEPGEEEPEATPGRLRRGMSRSRKALARPFTRAATRKAIDQEFWSEAEGALIAADAGVTCASAIVERAKKYILSEGISDLDGLKDAFRREIVAMLESFGRPPEPPAEKPRVILIIGVNGVGKTTTAAKIGFQMKRGGLKVLFAAADTFRAAGIEQMEMWANRIGIPCVRHQPGGDPAAVAFDAVESALARGTDVVLVDTAGRLHTKKNLMEELGKMWRVVDRMLAGGPEGLLVIDATTGQNGVNQARVFSEALDVGSIALTKMDGSAKGGVVLAIGHELGIPVAYIGVGEGMDDLRPFDPDEYARALF